MPLHIFPTIIHFLILRWCTKPKSEDSKQKPSYLPPPQPVFSPQPPQPVYSPQPPPTPAPPQPIFSSQPSQPVYTSSGNAPIPTASPAYYKPLPSSNKRKRTVGHNGHQSAPGRSGFGKKSKLLTSDPQKHW